MCNVYVAYSSGRRCVACRRVKFSSTRIGLYGPSGEPLPASPYRLVGWALYFAIEAYGSLSVLRLVESAVHPI